MPLRKALMTVVERETLHARIKQAYKITETQRAFQRYASSYNPGIILL